VPQAYASGEDAKRACTAAHKRLCSLAEWRTACRGEANRDFPYGETYGQGKCNVFGPAHPGVLLYDTPTINHTDPRFNLVKYKGKPLLNRTGALETCKSEWEGDAIYDMVGNVDEWIDDPEGTFVGGFYARAKKDGCQSIVSAHGFDYADGLMAQAGWRRQRVPAGALVHVDEVEADGGLAQLNFASSRGGQLDGLQLHHVGRAEFGEADGTGGGHGVSSGLRNGLCGGLWRFP
jgi:formylglycine-generating enzyme required for sulfatase activity